MAEDHIILTLPDGSERSYPNGTTGLQVAESISSGLAREALSITVSGDILDLDRPITHNATVAINTWKTDDGKYTFWHSSAHLLAEALQEIYPEAKFGIGPPIEQGFYYDVDFGDTTITPEDLANIEKVFLEKARQKSTFDRKEISKEDAIAHYKEKGNEYKVDLVEGLDDGSITFYTQGDFVDLCRGPHIPNSGVVKAIKLTNLAGAYWRGDVNSKQLTRIYGISFPKQKMLEEHLHLLEEAKKRDHRKLGKELGLFMFDKMIGQGLPVWKPKGTVLRRTLEDFLKDELIKRGYKEVITPHIGTIDLYKTSGHYPYYSDSQFSPIQVEDEHYMLKPMNCPHHHRIYSSDPHSYRDLPLRLAEFGSVYRYEQSGELSGLSRVRGFTQDDAHIYCTQDQLKDELVNAIELTQLVFTTFGMPVKTRLSFRDPANKEKYAGSDEMWNAAEANILEVAESMELDYFVGVGEAAFYGPKFDFIVRDALGRKWQLGTVQVDYVMPERFDLTYIGPDNNKHRPVIIHRAPFGSMERFTSILIEHFAGNFPLWLAPEQVRVLPISDAQNEYAHKLADALKEHKVRVTIDERSEQIGGKIRDAETNKIPYMLILGAKEQENETVSVRRHKKGDVGSLDFSHLISTITETINNKTLPED